MFQHYYELGLPVFPCKKNTKKAIPTAWQRFCKTLPTEQEIENWENKKDQYNLALACGEASGVIVIDIDTDNEDILKLLPESNVIRVGRPGRSARFFKYNAEIPSKKITFPNEKAPAIEILTNGRYCMIPPSIHPDTKKQFFWALGNEYDLKNLPELKPSDLERVCDFVSRNKKKNKDPWQVLVNDDPKRKCPHGAHDQLKSYAVSIMKRNIPIEIAVHELLKFDQQYHKPCGYFSDIGRVSDSPADPATNAYAFYANIMKSINRNRTQKGENPIGIPLEIENQNQEDQKTKIKQNLLTLTQPKGIMSYFCDYCKFMSEGTNSEALNLGSALAFMSVLCANRFKGKLPGYNVRPNLYIFNLAPSGIGKEVGPNLIKELLENTDLLGGAGYRSGSALVEDLPNQQSRLDIINEASAFIQMVSQAKNIWQSEIVEILSELFSSSDTKFFGFKNKGEKRIGAALTPHVSILAVTIPLVFRQKITFETATKGLLPRFLTFYTDSKGKLNQKNETEAEKLKIILKQIVRTMLENFPLKDIEHVKGQAFSPNRNAINQAFEEGIRYEPHIINFSKQAVDTFQNYRTDVWNRCEKADPFEEPFLNRFAELALKIALLHAVSQDRFDEVPDEDMKWAIEVIETQWKNARALYALATAENETHRNYLRIIEKIRDFGGMIGRRSLYQHCRFLSNYQFEEALKFLEIAGNVQIIEETTTGRRKTIIKLLKN